MSDINKRDELAIQSDIVEALKSVYDPEIPVNIYDLGLIYEVEVDDDRRVAITMTFTAPNCPMADEVVAEVKRKILDIECVSGCDINLTFDPPWTRDRMTEAAQLELGFL